MALIAYWPAINGEFVWDDHSWLWNSKVSSDPDGWYKGWQFWSAETPDYWPLTASVFWAQWHLFGREHLIGYHLLNIFLHALSAIVIWRLGVRLKVPGAWLIAVMFTVHPACVPSVAWITELKNTLSMVFFTLALLLYMRDEDSPKRWWYIAAIAAYFLALAAKTSIIMLPVLLLGIAWWRRGRITLKDILRSVPFFLLSGFFAATTIFFQHGHAMRGLKATAVPQSFFERLCIAGRAVWFYIRTDLLPVRLSLIYTRWNIDEQNLRHWIAPVAVVGLLAFLLLYRRSWTRPILGAYGYVLIVLFPVIGFFNMSFMHIAFVADHLQYIAIPGVIALVAGTGWWLACRSGIGLRVRAGPLAVVLIGLMTYETHARAASFESKQRLWTDTIKRNPNAWLAHNQLGLLARDGGRPDIAIKLHSRSLELKPEYPRGFNNRALAYAAIAKRQISQGNIAEANRLAAMAIADYDRAVQLKPDYATAYTNKGLVYYAQGKYREALEQHDKALSISPSLGIALNNRGTAYFQIGEYDKSIADLTKAIDALTHYADAHQNRGLAYYRTNKPQKAIADFTKALEYNPRLFVAYHARGRCYAQLGLPAKAVDDFSAMLRARPGFVPSYEHRGLAYLAMGQRQLAIDDFKAALAIDPRYTPAAEQLKKMKGTQ